MVYLVPKIRISFVSLGNRKGNNRLEGSRGWSLDLFLGHLEARREGLTAG